MSQIAKRLYATDDTFREVADLLFGDGASELVSKLSPEQKRKERRQAQVGLASNILGLGAGAQGLYAASKDSNLKNKVGTEIKTPKFKVTRGTKALAGGAVALQAANLGGDAVTNIVLRRAAKDDKKVHKSEPGSSDIYVPNGGRLRRLAAEKAYKKGREKAPELKRGSLRVLGGIQGPEVTGEPVKVARKSKVKKNEEVVWEGEFSKVDTDKRQVFGWASIVEMNGEPVVDLQGDFIDHDELEKSAYDYVIKSRKGGNMHARNGEEPLHVSDMIESFLVTPEKKEALGLPDEMPTGWWVGYQINDDDAWNLVKSGKRTGFSIHGRGQRTPTEI